MLRNKALSLVLSATCLVSANAAFAAPISVTGVHAMFAKTKTVKFGLHNDTAAPIELRTGDTTVTVEAGQTLNVDLPVGTKVTTTVATEKHQAGYVIVEVGDWYKGAVVHLN